MLCLAWTLVAQEAADNPFTYDPQDTQGDKFYNEFLNMMATLGLIIIVMVVIAWIVRRFTQTRLEQINTSSSMKILESRAISAKSTLYLLEVEGTGYVMAEHAQGITKIGEFELLEPESDL